MKKLPQRYWAHGPFLVGACTVCKAPFYDLTRFPQAGDRYLQQNKDSVAGDLQTGLCDGCAFHSAQVSEDLHKSELGTWDPP